MRGAWGGGWSLGPPRVITPTLVEGGSRTQKIKDPGFTEGKWVVRAVASLDGRAWIWASRAKRRRQGTRRPGWILNPITSAELPPKPTLAGMLNPDLHLLCSVSPPTDRLSVQPKHPPTLCPDLNTPANIHQSIPTSTPANSLSRPQQHPTVCPDLNTTQQSVPTSTPPNSLSRPQHHLTVCPELNTTQQSVPTSTHQPTSIHPSQHQHQRNTTQTLFQPTSTPSNLNLGLLHYGKKS